MWWEKNITGMREKITVKIDEREEKCDKKENINGYDERKERENNNEWWERKLQWIWIREEERVRKHNRNR